MALTTPTRSRSRLTKSAGSLGSGCGAGSRTGASQRRCRGGGQRAAPGARCARTNDVEAAALELAFEPFDVAGVLSQLLVGGAFGDAGQGPADGLRAVVGDARGDQRVHDVQLGRLAGVEMRILQAVGGIFEDEPEHQLPRLDVRRVVVFQQLDAAYPAAEELVRRELEFVLDVVSVHLVHPPS